MKSLCLLTICLSLFTNSLFNTLYEDSDYQRVYVYFSGVSIPTSMFTVEGSFYSRDGKNVLVQGNLCSASEPGSLDDRLYFFDIPSFAKLSSFNVIYNETKGPWSNTSLQKVDGCWFEYKTMDYTSICRETGWHDANLDIKSFCDYIFKYINNNDDNKCYGYGSYALLNESFSNYIFKNSKDKEFDYSWIDPYTEEPTTFKSKWNDLKDKYTNKYGHISKNYGMKILGIILLIVCGLFLAYLIYMNYGKEKRFFKHK